MIILKQTWLVVPSNATYPEQNIPRQRLLLYQRKQTSQGNVVANVRYYYVTDGSCDFIGPVIYLSPSLDSERLLHLAHLLSSFPLVILWFSEDCSMVTEAENSTAKQIATATRALQVQFKSLTKNPVEGFSVGMLSICILSAIRMLMYACNRCTR